MPEGDTRPDQVLIALAARGDQRAFEALYFRYRDWIVRLAYRYTREQNEAQEVLQDTWMYVLGKLPTLHLTARMTTFLYPVVRNKAIERSAKRRRAMGAVEAPALRLVDEATADPIPFTPNPEHAPLLAVLAMLPETHSEVILMRFVDDMAMHEIAAALGIPEGTVKSRLHNALKNLREDPRTARLFEI